MREFRQQKRQACESGEKQAVIFNNASVSVHTCFLRINWLRHSNVNKP